MKAVFSSAAPAISPNSDFDLSVERVDDLFCVDIYDSLDPANCQTAFISIDDAKELIKFLQDKIG